MNVHNIVLLLDEVSHGPGDPDPRAVRKRVIEIIHQVTNNSYREVGMLPTPAVAVCSWKFGRTGPRLRTRTAPAGCRASQRRTRPWPFTSNPSAQQTSGILRRTSFRSS